LDFTDDFGYLIVVDINKPHIQWSVQPDDPFFVGYINMGYLSKTNQLLGLAPHVTQTGFCDDGCFQFGSLDATSGELKLARFFHECVMYLMSSPCWLACVQVTIPVYWMWHIKQ
jgi:hypothetical protein